MNLSEIATREQTLRGSLKAKCHALEIAQKECAKLQEGIEADLIDINALERYALAAFTAARGIVLGAQTSDAGITYADPDQSPSASSPAPRLPMGDEGEPADVVSLPVAGSPAFPDGHSEGAPITINAVNAFNADTGGAVDVIYGQRAT